MKDHFETSKSNNNDSETKNNSAYVAHCVAYSTLVHNPLAVHHFCKVAKAVATAGKVTMKTVTRMAAYESSKKEAGVFVVVHTDIPV